VTFPAKGQFDAFVLVAFMQDPVGDTGIDQQTYAVTLQDSCPDGLLDLQTRAIIDGDGVNTAAAEEVAQHETGGPAADDSHGRGLTLYGRR
jgi:hypothetical protein